MSGTKHDQGKPDMALIDSEWIEGVAAVLTFGKKKYAAQNWRGGLAIMRLLSACLRHVFAFLRGENVDEESGLPHLHHAACCLMFASWMVTHRPELDDRYVMQEPAIDKAAVVEEAKRLNGPTIKVNRSYAP